MFDDVPPTVFWPLLVVFWFIVARAVGLFIGKVIRWCDQPKNRYLDEDQIAAMHRLHKRNGDKSKMGTR